MILIACLILASLGMSYRTIDRSAAIEWSETVYDFGVIDLNSPVTHEFQFVNRGDEPVVVVAVKTSCGCTVAEYTHDPVPTGGTGLVKATYNASKEGVFVKTVSLQIGEEEEIALTLKGEVRTRN